MARRALANFLVTIAHVELYRSYLIDTCRSGIATVPRVSDIAAPGGGQDDLVYVRVANDISARISSGELSAGTRLRAERDLATHYGVSYGTVRRAMQQLREEGLIVTIHGRGTFVKDPAQAS
jgi:hypothetical protein